MASTTQMTSADHVFASDYAHHYDLLYSEKDYQAECDILEGLLRQHSDQKIGTVLDLGCGTGGHAIPLTQRGYQVIGVDRSEKMLGCAEAKARSLKLPLEFHKEDICAVRLGRTFDACVSMFAVLCYQLNNDDVARTLLTARNHLKAGGLFIFDFWYGPAVLTVRPSERMKTVQKNGIRLVRLATPSLDIAQHANETEYRLLVIDGQRVIHETTERHRVRYFFPLELEHYLRDAGFELVALMPFPNTDEPVSDRTWNVVCVGRAT